MGSCKLAGCIKAAVVKGLYERGYTKGGRCGNVDSKRCFKMHMKYNQKNIFIYPFYYSDRNIFLDINFLEAYSRKKKKKNITVP